MKKTWWELKRGREQKCDILVRLSKYIENDQRLHQEVPTSCMSFQPWKQTGHSIQFDFIAIIITSDRIT